MDLIMWPIMGKKYSCGLSPHTQERNSNERHYNEHNTKQL